MCAGVGKTAIAEGLALAIVQRAGPDGSPLPEFLHSKRVMQLDVGLIVAGGWWWCCFVVLAGGGRGCFGWPWQRSPSGSLNAAPHPAPPRLPPALPRLPSAAPRHTPPCHGLPRRAATQAPRSAASWRAA
jgi:hypothetical protein